MNQPIDQISDSDLAEVIRVARQERGGKAAKYTSLERYRESILKLMQQDVQLSHILRWLKEKHGEQLVLNTLRKYIVWNIGRSIYDEYLLRNSWLKNRSNPNTKQPAQPPAQAATVTVVKTVSELQDVLRNTPDSENYE